MKNFIKALAFTIFISLSFAGSASADAYFSDAIQEISDGSTTGAELTFSYSSTIQYRVNAQVGYMTDIMLGPGEELIFIGGGDTSRWLIETSRVNDRPHIYLKPIKGNIDTNLIINTNQKVYRLLVVSTDNYYPAVSWRYPADEMAKQIKDNNFYIAKTSAKSPDEMNFSYKVKGKRKNLYPISVMDDGKITYIKMPAEVASLDAPVLHIREKGSKELSLVNYSVKDDCFIVDRIFDTAELRFNSGKDFIRIDRKEKP